MLGAGLLLSKWARPASYGVIALMVLFIPVHVYMIQVGGVRVGGGLPAALGGLGAADCAASADYARGMVGRAGLSFPGFSRYSRHFTRLTS